MLGGTNHQATHPTGVTRRRTSAPRHTASVMLHGAMALRSNQTGIVELWVIFLLQSVALFLGAIYNVIYAQIPRSSWAWRTWRPPFAMHLYSLTLDLYLTKR